MAWGFEFRVYGLGLGFWGFELRVCQGFGFGVLRLGFWV